jgi:hypothetical protein
LILLFFGCAGGGNAAEVAVLEPVAVAFEGDYLGVVDEVVDHGGGYLTAPVECPRCTRLGWRASSESIVDGLPCRVYDGIRVEGAAGRDASGTESTTVLADGLVLDPADRFLAHLTVIDRSQKTVRAYAHDLRDYFEFLQCRGLHWDRVVLEDLGRIVHRAHGSASTTECSDSASVTCQPATSAQHSTASPMPSPTTDRAPSGSVQTKTEGVTCRVQEDPEGRTGLVRMSGRTELDHCRLGGVKVVNEHIEVHLLGPLLGRPPRRRVTSHTMKGDALAVLGAHRSSVGGDVDLPIQHRAVEPGERTRIGTVDNDEGRASDGHASHDIDDSGRHTSGFRSDVPALLTVVRPLVPMSGHLTLGRRGKPQLAGSIEPKYFRYDTVA